MKTLKAIISAYFKMVLAGGLAIFIIYLLLPADGTTTASLQMIGLVVLNCFFSFIFSIAFLLPVSVLEEHRIKTCPVKELFKRYLPLMTMLPFALFVWAVITILPQVAEKDWTEYYFSISCAILPVCLGPLGMWTFLTKLKS